jgi:hypothetical protein
MELSTAKGSGILKICDQVALAVTWTLGDMASPNNRRSDLQRASCVPTSPTAVGPPPKQMTGMGAPKVWVQRAPVER